MKMLSNEVKSLLDKLYNLRGEDSVILTKMNKEREEALETQERTKNEKSVLLEKIDKLSVEEKTLQQEGEKLTKVLSSINRDDFANVLDRLQIDFNPSVISEKLNSMLPSTIEKVVAENKLATEELEDVEKEMNNAITKAEELSIRKEEALNNQARLNEYFELALDGNINITRDAITGLLEKFDFNEDEQREAAKILMFPEDALYEYDASKKSSDKNKGRTITDVLVEAKKESTVKEEVKEEIDTVDPEVIASSEQDSKLENIFDQVIEEHAEELNLEESGKSDKEALKELLTSLKVDVDRLSNEDLEKILTGYDETLIKNNIECLNSLGIDLNILISYSEILIDHELKEKLEKLMTIGKEAKDISLMPSVLTKYDLKGLNNTINVLQISGLDPKKVPLMAY